MAERVIETADSYRNITGTTTIKGDRLQVVGLLVASSAAGTIKITDGDGATVVNTMSVAAATYYKIPVKLKGDVTITVGGTLDATLFYSV